MSCQLSVVSMYGQCLLLVVRCFSGVVNREAAVVSRECYCELCAVSCEI